MTRAPPPAASTTTETTAIRATLVRNSLERLEYPPDDLPGNVGFEQFGNLRNFPVVDGHGIGVNELLGRNLEVRVCIDEREGDGVGFAEALDSPRGAEGGERTYRRRRDFGLVDQDRTERGVDTAFSHVGDVDRTGSGEVGGRPLDGDAATPDREQRTSRS